MSPFSRQVAARALLYRRRFTFHPICICRGQFVRRAAVLPNDRRRPLVEMFLHVCDRLFYGSAVASWLSASSADGPGDYRNLAVNARI